MQESLHHDDPEQLLAQGIAAIKVGDQPRARELLARAIQLRPADERMWLWMSGAVENDNDRRRCLERVLQLNPGNQAAQRGLAAITAAPAPPASPPPAPPITAAPPTPPISPPLAAEPAPPAWPISPPPARAAEPAPPAPPISPPPARAAEPIPPPSAAEPPIVLSPLHIPESAAPASPILRRLSEQPVDPSLPAPPEPRSGVLVMADLEKLRSATQPTRSWRVRPLVIVLVVVLIVLVVLAAVLGPQLLGLA